MAIVPALGQVAQADTTTASTTSSKPLRIVTTTSAGGALDAIARTIAHEVESQIGVPVIVEAKPGANGLIAVNHIRNSPADGHAILLSLSSMVQNSILRSDLGYKLSDLKPLTMIAVHPMVFSGSAVNEAKSLEQFLQMARTAPRELAFGSNGVGSAGHILGQTFALESDITLLYTPYTGESNMLISLVRNDVQAAIVSPSGVLPFANDGKIVPYAVTGAKRLKALPDTPTFEELGLKKSGNLSGWSALFLKAGTPDAISDELYRILQQAILNPEVVEKLQSMEYEANPISPAEFDVFLTNEHQRWAEAISAAGPLE